MLRPAAHAIVPTLAALMIGCAASPPSHYYALSASTRAAAKASNLAIAVGPVSLPALVDRPQIVVRNGPNEVRLDELNRWASPLQDNLSRVVAENLAASLGTPRVSLFPLSSSADPDYRVVIDVQHFESTPGTAAMLDATWTVHRMSDTIALSGRSKRIEPVQGRGYDALAAAHSRALEQMSDEIAAAIRGLGGLER